MRSVTFWSKHKRQLTFYEASDMATIDLCLRRSVHRSVILIITFEVHYSLNRHCEELTRS